MAVSAATDRESAPVTVSVSGAEGNLGMRVIRLLEADDSVVVAKAAADSESPAVDVVVHLGSGDHDARARRRENVTEGVDKTLAEAIARDANHLVLVSSAKIGRVHV